MISKVAYCYNRHAIRFVKSQKSLLAVIYCKYGTAMILGPKFRIAELSAYP